MICCLFLLVAVFVLFAATFLAAAFFAFCLVLAATVSFFTVFMFLAAFAFFHYAEGIYAMAIVLFSGVQLAVIPSFKVAFVGAVGEVLRFKTNSCAELDGLTVFSVNGTIKEVSSIDLNAGFISEYG